MEIRPRDAAKQWLAAPRATAEGRSVRTGGGSVARVTRADTYGERLRWAAFKAVCRGWPVVPGRFGTDSEGVVEMRPLLENRDAAVTNPDHAWSIWGQQPYGVTRRPLDFAKGFGKKLVACRHRQMIFANTSVFAKSTPGPRSSRIIAGDPHGTARNAVPRAVP